VTTLLRALAPVISLVPIMLMAAERRLIRELRRGDAFGPERAIALRPRRALGRFRLTRLVDGGAVRMVGGACYLDEAAYAAYRGRRRRRALVIIPIVVLVALALARWSR
jgi:hypothetical protein